LGRDWRKEFKPQIALPRMHDCFVFGAKATTTIIRAFVAKTPYPQSLTPYFPYCVASATTTPIRAFVAYLRPNHKQGARFGFSVGQDQFIKIGAVVNRWNPIVLIIRV